MDLREWIGEKTQKKMIIVQMSLIEINARVAGHGFPSSEWIRFLLSIPIEFNFI